MAETKKLTGDNRIDFGWYSRRHQTAREHTDARDAYDAKRERARLAAMIAKS